VTPPPGNPLVEQELDAVDWASLRTQTRNADDVPDAVRAMVSVEDHDAGWRAYCRLDNYVMVQGRLYEAAQYLIPVLLAALAGPLSGAARRAVADLLADLALGAADPSEAEAGNMELDAKCREAFREGLWLGYQLLLDPDSAVVASAIHIVNEADPDRRRVARTMEWLGSHAAQIVRQEAARIDVSESVERGS
jgi:hypothetical protein